MLSRLSAMAARCRLCNEEGARSAPPSMQAKWRTRVPVEMVPSILPPSRTQQ
jgi:hypothetical protein